MAGERLAGLAGKVTKALEKVETLVMQVEVRAAGIRGDIGEAVTELKSGLASLREQFTELTLRLAEDDDEA